jgi:hypothetical protein
MPSIPYEIALAFLSRIILISCGNNDIAVHIPANKPIYSSNPFSESMLQHNKN